MAIEFPNITADVIEANEFPELSQRYGVSGVPMTIINDKVEFTGAVPEPYFLAAIRQAMGIPHPAEDESDEESASSQD
jgi:predicted DsbA family dithiol-disulfide isomerase